MAWVDDWGGAIVVLQSVEVVFFVLDRLLDWGGRSSISWLWVVQESLLNFRLSLPFKCFRFSNLCLLSGCPKVIFQTGIVIDKGQILATRTSFSPNPLNRIIQILAQFRRCTFADHPCLRPFPLDFYRVQRITKRLIASRVLGDRRRNLSFRIVAQFNWMGFFFTVKLIVVFLAVHL